MASFDDIAMNWPDGPGNIRQDRDRYIERLAGLDHRPDAVCVGCKSHHLVEWMDGCRHAFQAKAESEVRRWLTAVRGTREYAILNHRGDLAPIFQAHLRAVLVALNSEAPEHATAQAHQPPGLIQDLADDIRGVPLQSFAQQQMIVVLSPFEPAVLHAELRSAGSGAAYPRPCQAFVPRDPDFRATERRAVCLLRHAGRGDCDLRWRIELFSRRPVPGLIKDSLTWVLYLQRLSRVSSLADREHFIIER